MGLHPRLQPGYAFAMPLVVYLDTSDYITLFNEPDDGPSHKILAKLIDFRERGVIVIGFSFVTVLEFITRPDAANRQERVRRGQLVKDICGPNAFPFPSDIPRGATFPNDGMWMLRKNQKSVSAAIYREQIRSMFVDKIAQTSGLNRQMRRKLGRPNSFAELLRQLGPHWKLDRTDFRDFPVTDEIIDSRIFERFMAGQCSDLEFERRVSAWFSDPAEYSRLVYDYADHPDMLRRYFGSTIDQIEKLVSDMQGVILALKALNSELLQVRKNLISAGVDKSDARKLAPNRPIPTFTPDDFNEKLAPLYGEGRTGQFGHYLSRAVQPEYKFKQSDVMDLMQMCYVPDCDLFRCDKAMAHMFKDFPDFEGKIVGRFSELPERIEERMNHNWGTGF